MDVSLNMIDLEYLTNPVFLKVKKKMTKNNDKVDITFYRKRIFQLTKDFLCGKYINAELDNSFRNYTRTCIDYFKFIDQSDIIQEEYSKINLKMPPPPVENIPLPNHLLMRHLQPISKTIPDCYPIKYINKPPKPYLPKNRNINLKDPKFRSKGVIKKNVNNTYGKKKPKKKKKDAFKKQSS